LLRIFLRSDCRSMGSEVLADPGEVFALEGDEIAAEIAAEIKGAGDGIPVLGEVVDFALGDGGAGEDGSEAAGAGVSEEIFEARGVDGRFAEEEREGPKLGVVGVDAGLGHFDDPSGMSGEEIRQLPEGAGAEGLAERGLAVGVEFRAEDRLVAIPVDGFVLGGEAFFEPGGEATFESEPGVLVPGFVGDDGEGAAAAEVITGEDALLTITAGGDLEINGGVGAGLGTGVSFPLVAGGEDVAIEGFVGGVFGKFAIVQEGGFDDPHEKVPENGIVHGGADAEMIGGDLRAVVAVEGPSVHVADARIGRERLVGERRQVRFRHGGAGGQRQKGEWSEKK
jgi:hypothetical protein